MFVFHFFDFTLDFLNNFIVVFHALKWYSIYQYPRSMRRNEVNMRHIHIGFIGLGLIGGSIAKALRAEKDNLYITAYDINKNSLTAAFNEGVVDSIADVIDDKFGSCDFIFLCAPVQKNDSNLEAVKAVISPDCILTDVGSVKTDIHKHIAAAGLNRQFIGGHPMAGSERFGYANSNASLLENAYYILTPTEETLPEKLEDYRDLVQSMGAIPLTLNYRQHDYVTAAISHLPHVIASSLVNLVRDADSEDGIMKMIAAGGFKDITRIASSSAGMWQQICLTNTENISSLLDAYIHALQAVKQEIDSRNEISLYDFFDHARAYRDSFVNTSSGPIKRCYEFTVDIADQTGALASIATILAVNGVSIKNIGITHNREHQAGALRLEFDNEKAMEKAKSLLTARSYTIYEKKL